MKPEFRILIIEDVPEDAELIKRTLSKGSFCFLSKTVDKKEDFIRELKEFSPDLILSDYSMPGFTGLEALKIAKEVAPSTPFIIVTGSINEETAVECMKTGAVDYVLKDRLTRIEMAVKTALENKHTRDEKAHIEKALTASAIKWRNTFDAINDAVCLLDKDGSVLRCNNAMKNLVGKPFSEIIGKGCSVLFRDAASPDKLCLFARMYESLHRETTLVELNNRWFDVLVDPILDETGALIGGVQIISDVTERKRAEEALQESEKKYREVVENASDIIFTTDINGNYTFANKAGMRISGYTMEELRILNYMDLIISEYKKKVQAHFIRQYRTGEPHSFIEYPFKSRNGDIIWLAQNISLVIEDNQVIGFHNIARNITERKKAELTLQNSETRYRTLFESSSDAVMLLDENGFFDCNSATLLMFGLKDKTEFIGLHPSYLSPATQPCGTDSLTLANNMIATAMKEGMLRFEWIHKRLDNGEDFPAEVMLTRMYIEGRPIIQSTVRDISERKQAEQKLTIFRSLIDQSNDTIEVIDMETGRFLDVNEKGYRDHGYSREEYLSLSVFDIDPMVNQSLYTGIKENLKISGFFIWEGIHRRKDGSEFPVEVNIKYVRIDRDYMIAVVRDITERKQAEEAIAYERLLLRTIIDNIPVAVYAKDKECCKVLANSFDLININKPESEVIGRTDMEILPKEVAERTMADDLSVIRDGKEVINREELIINNKGEHRWLLTSKLPWRDKEGNITGLVGIGYDITERKLVENEKEKSLQWRQGVNQLQQLLLETAPLVDKLKRVTDSIVRIFDADFCRIWLIRPGDICERGCMHALVQEGPHVCRYPDKCLHLLASSGRYTHSDGEGHRRVPFGCYKIGRIASGEDHKFITNDAQNDLRVHNHEWARELGLASFAGYQIHIPGGETLGVLALFAKHPIIPDEDVILDGISSAVAMVIQQAAAEEELRVSEEKLRSVFNASPDAITVLDLNGTILDCNPATLKMHGYSSKEELTGRSAFDLVAPEERKKAMASLNEVFEKDFVDRLEFKLVKKDGLEFPGEISAGVIHDPTGKPQSIVVLSKDITERKKAEEIRIRLETSIEQSSDIIVITDLNGTIQYVNPAFEKITGYRREEAIGQNPRIFKSGKHDEVFYINLWDTIMSGMQWNGRFINKKKDGQLYTEEASITPIKDSTGAITNFTAVKRDVTNELLVEQRIRETQKMEAMGTLAGGIAHDFNNILAAIIGYTELSLDTVPEDSQLHSDLTKIFKAGNRARDLINQILTFSRQREQEKRPIQIAPIIKEALKLLRASLPSSIEIRRNIESETGTILTDPTQIHQIIMNLCTNAGHAMSEKGGILEVSLSNEALDTGFCLAHPGLIPGPYLKLMVSDTGHGIAPYILPRIFEPYFTTKEKSGGTGLGLSVVHGIVTSYSGVITVYSEIGKGTTFKVYLPVITEKPAVETETKPSFAKGHEHILFVDDEQDIVNVGKRILEQLGYTVTTVLSSMDALGLFQKDPSQFDLVITDMTMPFMTGDELAAELMHIRQDIPIIVCTGYSEKLTEEKAMSIGIRDYMGKPLLKSEMAETVRKVLDQQSEDN